MQNTLSNAIKSALRITVTSLVTIVILFEEWGWEPLKKTFFWIFRHPLWVKIRQKITTLSPYSALVVFLVPFLINTSFKILGFLLFFAGRTTLGIFIIVLAKILGTATFAWAYQVTLPQLMQIHWVAPLLNWWLPWKDRLILKAKNSRIWRKSRYLKRQAKKYINKTLCKIKTWLH